MQLFAIASSMAIPIIEIGLVIIVALLWLRTANTIGIPGGFTASVTLSLGGTYIGGGNAGWSGGSSFTINPTERGYDVVRKWVEATFDQYQQGYTGPVGIDTTLEGHWRNNGDPPMNFLTDIYVQCQFSVGYNGAYTRTVLGVFFIERFSARGSTTAGSSKYTIKGKSDGPLTLS